MKQNTHLLGMLRTATAASALVLAFGAALAQGPVQGTPRVEQPNQGGGGGVGIGINIDLGSVINAIRNATKRDDQTKPPVLQKKAVTVSSGSSGNYTIDWVVQYANNTGATLPKVTVTDGPIATIINPSLVPGLIPQQGWTGTTNANVPVDNYALFSGTNIAPHGVMTATFPAPYPANIATGGKGDGYQPIPYTKSSAPAGFRIYKMNHHLAPGILNFSCTDVVLGSSCTPMSGSWPRVLPAGDSSGKASGTTTNNMEYVIDSGRLFYASMGPAGAGIGCFNLETETECGLTKFVNTPMNIQGPWRIGNELYVAASDGSLFCSDLSNAMAACTGGNYKIPLADFKVNTSTGYSEWYWGIMAARVVGTKLYVTSLKIGTPTKYVNCFDSITKKACWNTLLPTRGTSAFSYPSSRANVSNFLYYDTGNNPVALCTMEPVQISSQTCVDLGNGSEKLGLPVVLSALNLGAGLETHSTNKTYFVATTFQVDTRADSWCWNWTTQSACTTLPDGVIAKGPTTPDNYGSNVDDEGCIWVYGDKSKLWHFDPNNIDAATGLAKPCGGGSKFIKVFQPLQYCSGPKPFRWTSVEVKGALLANYDKFIVKVLDSSNNTVLFTKDLKASGQLLASITGVDAQTLSKPLKIEVEYTPKTGMGASDKPYLEVRYNAPPIEFCFKSTHTCEQGKITNVVETPDPAVPGKYISVKVDVDKPQNCTVNPPPPVCGQAGQPPCPICGTASTPTCAAQCGQLGQPACPTGDTTIITGSSNAGLATGIGIGAGGILGGAVRPPVMSNGSTVCVTGDCAPKAEQSTGQEFKEAKVACVRKAKPVDAPVAAAKPKPKPAVAATPPAPVDPNAPPKPKPKPRPKPAQAKPAAQDEDC